MENNKLKMILRNIVAEYGIDILMDSKNLGDKLDSYGVDSKTWYQILFFLDVSSIRRYLQRDINRITMIEINNIILSAQADTGLSVDTIKEILFAILYAVGVNADISINNFYNHDVVLRGCEVEDIVDFDECKNICEKMQAAIDENDDVRITMLADDFNRCIKAGYPDALFLQSKACAQGIGTAKDTAKAERYCKLAAKNGHVKASNIMGRINFEKAFYTNAYKYYSNFGSAALNNEDRDNLEKIIANKNQNLKTLVFAGILLVFMIILNCIVGKGLLSVNLEPHWITTSISTALLVITYGLSIAYYCLLKYDLIKWVVSAMFAIFAIMLIIAL